MENHVTQIINIADYRKPVQDTIADDIPTVRDLWNKIRRDMMMGATFWDYTTKQELQSPREVLEHFILHADLQIRSPLNEDGEPVVLCGARKRGEECPGCQEIEGKLNENCESQNS